MKSWTKFFINTELKLKLEFELQSFDKITIISNWWAYGKPFEWQETTGPISCCLNVKRAVLCRIFNILGRKSWDLRIEESDKNCEYLNQSFYIFLNHFSQMSFFSKIFNHLIIYEIRKSLGFKILSSTLDRWKL